MIRNQHKSKKKKRRVRRQPEPRLAVKPSAAIDARVDEEVAKGTAVAHNLRPDNLFASGYLVSAIYYHDGLFATFNAARRDADPADRIVARIATALPTGIKAAFVAHLDALYADCAGDAGPGRFVIPVPFEPIQNSIYVHPFAIDLFCSEGTPIRSATQGIVVLAEFGWQPEAWFGTSSVRGGNAVIVFEPATRRFYRYAHMETIHVASGMCVEAGDVIGAVGHTGFNANRKGHGRHLHFEINEFDPRTGLVAAVPHDALEAILLGASATFPESGPTATPQTARE